jgi:hypothetical protein
MELLDSYQFGSSGPAFASVLFRDRSRATLAPVVLREWDFGDGVVSTEADPRHTFVGGKSYDVTLRCTDSLGYESSCVRRVAASAVANNRVDVTLELSVGKTLLLPRETMDVALKCKSSGNSVPLSVNVVTLYKDSRGAVIERAAEPLKLTANLWQALERSTVMAGRELFDTGEIVMQVEYLGLCVASGKVILARASNAHLDLQADQDQLRDKEGTPIVLRLSEDRYQPRVEAASRRLRNGGAVRILVVDDSLAGPSGSGYPELVAERLRARFPKAGVELTRTGLQAGSRVYQPIRGVVEFPQEAEAAHADVVVLAASLRDVLRFMPVERFERLLQASVDRIEAETGAEVVLVAPPPTIVNPGRSQAYAVAVRRIGLRRGLAVADAYSAFMKAGARGGEGTDSADAWRQFYRDPDSSAPIYRISPAAAGQELIAQAVEQALLAE